MSKLILFHYSKGKNYDSTDGSNDIYDKYKRSCHIRILLPDQTPTQNLYEIFREGNFNIYANIQTAGN